MKPQIVKDLFINAYKNGLSYHDIAKLLNISHRTALYWRIQLGLPKRKNLGGGYSRGV